MGTPITSTVEENLHELDKYDELSSHILSMNEPQQKCMKGVLYANKKQKEKIKELEKFKERVTFPRILCLYRMDILAWFLLLLVLVFVTIQMAWQSEKHSHDNTVVAPLG